MRIEAIEHDRVQLRKGQRQRVLRLRDDIAVLKTARPAGRQARRDDATSREPGGPPADEEDDATLE
jgi:hypothetical protein